MNYGALSAFTEFSVSLAILLTRRASVVAETSQHSTETIPNLALFHEAIFTAVSTRPCTEAAVTAGCTKPLCQELHNIAVMEETYVSIRDIAVMEETYVSICTIWETLQKTPAATYIFAYQLLLRYSKSSKTVLWGILPDRDQSLLPGSNV